MTNNCKVILAYSIIIISIKYIYIYLFYNYSHKNVLVTLINYINVLKIYTKQYIIFVWALNIVYLHHFFDKFLIKKLN